MNSDIVSFIHCSARSPVLEVLELVSEFSTTVTLNSKELLTRKYYTLWRPLIIFILQDMNDKLAEDLSIIKFKLELVILQ